MDKSLLLFRGGVRSAQKKLADGQEHTLHFRARTPNEIALYVGAVNRIPDTEDGDLMRQNMRARLIADSMCNEDGTPLMTYEDAQLVPASLKPELCQMILDGSNEIGDLGKGSPPAVKSGSGTS